MNYLDYAKLTLMPVIEESSYKAPWVLKNPDLATIYPALFRVPAKIHYQRERIVTEDDDFLDLDWSKVGSNSLAIITHGLEGSSRSHYMTHAVKSLNDKGIDVLAMNYRDCSGEPNKLLKSYHSGKTEDLATIVEYIEGQYQTIYLIGFSIGGNLVLKYLGEKKDLISKKIKLAITFAVPFCLEACARELARPKNWIYMKYFLLKLHEKIKIKQKLFPGEINDRDFYKIKNFYDYDRIYTAPLNGFKDEYDYWQKASSKSFLKDIRVTSLTINALDDPFLIDDCYPFAAAKSSDYFWLETPKYGGHAGFANFAKTHWWQDRMIEIIFKPEVLAKKSKELTASS